MNPLLSELAPVAARPPFLHDKLPPLVLVVDDSRMLRELIAIILKKNGYCSVEAENGFTARLLLEIVEPALVITDLEMPGYDGWDLIEYCHERYPAVPVMVTSGTARGRHPQIERFASAFVSKPFSIPRFRSEIRRLLDQTPGQNSA